MLGLRASETLWSSSRHTSHFLDTNFVVGQVHIGDGSIFSFFSYEHSLKERERTKVDIYSCKI